MRIDPYFGAQQTSETGRSQQNAAVSTSSNAEPQADQAQLSGAHAQVQALAAQASQLPEVRQAKVQALREAVQNGQYHVSSSLIAGSLMSEMTFPRGA